MNFFERWKGKIRKYFQNRGFTCDACGAEVFNYPENRLCEKCEGELSFNDGKTCPKCGRKTAAEGVCLSCKRRMPKFTVGISPLVYEGKSASLVNRLKNGKITLAPYFAERMTDDFLKKYGETERFYSETLLVVPVPLTEKRRTERGFNQAEELAGVIAERLQEEGYLAELFTELLLKTKETAQQKQMNALERAENAAGAYRVHLRKECRDKTVLLVDDILTTGATGSECAERLLGAGAKEVIFLTATALPEKQKEKKPLGS